MGRPMTGAVQVREIHWHFTVMLVFFIIFIYAVAALIVTGWFRPTDDGSQSCRIHLFADPWCV